VKKVPFHAAGLMGEFVFIGWNPDESNDVTISIQRQNNSTKKKK
jgi:hypothetical protein